MVTAPNVATKRLKSSNNSKNNHTHAIRSHLRPPLFRLLYNLNLQRATLADSLQKKLY